MFEKVTRQITNRIDELEDNIKRSGGPGGGGGSMAVGGGGPSGGGDGGYGGGDGDGSLGSMVQHQTFQITEVKGRQLFSA